MSESTFIRADEMAELLEISKPQAYKIIRQLNNELKEKGYMTIAGRVHRDYFSERFMDQRVKVAYILIVS